MGNSSAARGLKIIIDSNVFIAAEDHGEATSAHTRDAAELFRSASQVGATLVIAAGTQDDILRGPVERRVKRLAQLTKYKVLGSVFVRPDLAQSAGFPVDRSANDQSDLEILAALDVGAADWLVTSDEKLRRRAARAGFGDNVFSVHDAIESLRAFINQPTSIPDIKTVPGYRISLTASLFADLRADYPDFDDWWRNKVAREERDVLILGLESDPEALSVLKVETDRPHQLVGKVLKISTFRVAAAFEGARRGELMLPASIDYARKNRCEQIYLEVFSSKLGFIEWLETFGFTPISGATTVRGEVVLRKFITPDLNSISALQPLEFNIAYGPGAMVVHNPLIVPIKKFWRKKLLPQTEPQLQLLRFVEACGNAIRKAYLCNAQIRSISPGDTLLFYESEGRSAIVSIGVAESVMVSRDTEDILRFVGNRTVYSPQEIERLCAKRDVLSIRFRFDRTLEEPWSRQTLTNAGVMRGTPQSIQRVKSEGVAWIRSRFAV